MPNPQTPENPSYPLPPSEPLENSFQTTDLPDAEKERRNRANKRMIGLFVILSLVVAGFIVWEIIDLLSGFGA